MIALIILAVSLISTILFLAHYFVYRTIIRFLHITNNRVHDAIEIIFLTLAFSFILATVFSFFNHSAILKIFYKLSAVWLGAMYWLLLASLLIWLIYLVTRLLSLQPDLRIGFSLVLLLVLVINIYGLWHSSQTVVVNKTVFIKNLPESWQGRRAVLIADTHFGNIRNVGTAERVAKLIQEQNPDIVLIAGDFYDGVKMTSDKYTVAQPFGSIKSTYGTYFAPGNHEVIKAESELLIALSQAGIKVLSNEKTNIDGIELIGVDYQSTTTENGQIKVLNSLNLDEDSPKIMIKHVPNLINIAEKFKVDLQLSGHTHVGQVFPLGYITRLIYGDFYYGLNNFGDMQVLTTSGVGTWGPPQRVGTNSEIVVIDFQLK